MQERNKTEQIWSFWRSENSQGEGIGIFTIISRVLCHCGMLGEQSFVLSLKVVCTPMGAPFSAGGMIASMLYLDDAVNDYVYNALDLIIKAILLLLLLIITALFKHITASTSSADLHYLTMIIPT